MTPKSLGKIAVVVLVATAFLAAAVPLGLYWLGLSNVEGRPNYYCDTDECIARAASPPECTHGY